MKTKQLKRMLLLIVCTVLIAAIALFTIGCSSKNNSSGSSTPEAGSAQSDVKVLGEGSRSFAFCVTDAEGSKTLFEINTNKETVGEALQELDLIDGDKGDFGIYVKTVNGITYDYNTHGKYWAFYADGKYAASGADTTKIKKGVTYEFKAE